ncbi:hypothetical protein R3X25_05475 [Lutibacter sp. TH_r2]|uniref:hypothetical protein n=1 Tax=Lutibacter sp. TH_r2 TaxID=3082083 RepID=UPI002954D635|nr:hypothetical protein [Lutibacter sp. TH_r2]MDV7186725.1 hypothetical protein [Lutibacter sp. TH_r2]
MIKRVSLVLVFLTFSLALYSQNVLYVYGDVAADGSIPSGDKKPFHQMRLNDEGRLGMSGFKKALEEVKMNISEVYDQDIRFTKNYLKDIDVVILASNQRMFDTSEAKAVKVWVENGGGLVIWSDSAFGGDYKEVGVDNPIGRDSDNSISEQFGMYFLTDNGAGNYLVKNYTENHFLNNFNKKGGIKFRGEGVSFVRTSKPAKVLAKAQEGGLGGKLRVNKIDGVFNDKTDASLSIAEIKKGRVIGLFDRNLFWNAGAGTQLSHSDNKEFTQRMIIWAAQVENEARIIENTNTKKLENFPPEISISKELLKDGKTLEIKTVITDNDEDGIDADISWKQLKGPATAIFENNNPNTTEPTIRLPQKGEYVFQARINDGEFNFRRSVSVIRD